MSVKRDFTRTSSIMLDSNNWFPMEISEQDLNNRLSKYSVHIRHYEAVPCNYQIEEIKPKRKLRMTAKEELALRLSDKKDSNPTSHGGTKSNRAKVKAARKQKRKK